MYDAGGIKYTIEADAAALLQAEALIDKSLEKQSKAFKEADRQVRAYEKTQKDLGRVITSSGVVMDKNNAVLVEQTRRYRELSTAANASHANMVRLTSTAQGVNSGLRGMSHNMTNLSYQLQDIAVQAQMGINPFMIASQQLPQMLVGMGAAAAGIGAAVAVLGGLAMAYIDTSTQAEKLSKSIENIKASITLGVDGVIGYTEEMERLGKVSEMVANFQIRLLGIKAKESLKETKGAIAEVMDGFNDGTLMDFNDAMKYSYQITSDIYGEISKYGKSIGEALGASGDEARKLGREFVELVKSVENAGSVEEIDRIQTRIVELAQSTGKATPEIQKLIGEMFSLFGKAREAAATLSLANGEVEAMTESSIRASNTFNSMTKSLQTQIIELEKGKRAAFEFTLSQTNMTEAQKDALLADYDRAASLKAMADEAEKAADDMAWLNNEIAKLDQEDKTQKIRLEGQVQTIGLSQEDQIKAKYARELELLREAEQQGIEIKGEYSERYKELKRQETEEIKKLNGQQGGEFSAAMQAMENQAIGAFAQVVTGAKSGRDAIRDLANSILTQMIGALIKQGIAAATASSTAASAQVASNNAITASATPAAAAQSLASFGANSGPALAGIAAVTAAALGMAAISGRREMGGPVSNGKSYLVGERGPEIFTPSGSGSITSNKDLMGGGNVNVIVNNNAPGTTASATQNSTGDIEIVINAISDQVLSGQGKFARALRQGTNTQFKASL